MSLNHPSIVIRTHDLERGLMRTTVDHGPRTARCLAGQDARARAAGLSRVVIPGSGGAVRSPAGPALQRVGAALVSFGLLLQGLPSVAEVVALPVERGTGA